MIKIPEYYSNGTVIRYLLDYKFKFNIDFGVCRNGESYALSTYECLWCPENYYSLVND